MGVAPVPQFPEKPNGEYRYDRALGVNGARKGPQRFQEGVESDTDVPRDFGVGVTAGTDWPITHRKTPQETLKERAHVGSAAWIEAPSYLRGFASGAGEVPQQWGYEFRDGGRQQRINPTRVDG